VVPVIVPGHLGARVPARLGSGRGLLGLVALVLAAGCGRGPSHATHSGSNVVVTIEGIPIGAAQLEAEYGRTGGSGPAGSDKEKLLASLIDRETAYLKAIRSGFLETPEIQQAVRALVVARYRESREGEIPQVEKVTEEQVRAVYAAGTPRFLRPAAFNLALLKLEFPQKADEEHRSAALRRAVQLRDRARTECQGLSHFGPLAAEFSVDQGTRYRGGEQGWMNVSEAGSRLPDAVAQAAATLTQPGQISDPIAASDGIYLLKLIGRRPEQLRPFDEVRPRIEHELALAARAEREARWRSWCREGLDIRIHADELARVPIPPAAQSPVPAPPPMNPR
jgi:hypothetical protein